MSPSDEWKQARYDAAWKQFFGLSVAVEHLLRGFFPDIAALLDFGSLRDVSSEWVFDGDRRLADAVWRADYRDGSGRSLLIPVEHQSTVDRAMARRVLRNAGMAFERLRRDRALDSDGRLRPFMHRAARGRGPLDRAGSGREGRGGRRRRGAGAACGAVRVA